MSVSLTAIEKCDPFINNEGITDMERASSGFGGGSQSVKNHAGNKAFTGDTPEYPYTVHRQTTTRQSQFLVSAS